MSCLSEPPAADAQLLARPDYAPARRWVYIEAFEAPTILCVGAGKQGRSITADRFDRLRFMAGQVVMCFAASYEKDYGMTP